VTQIPSIPSDQFARRLMQQVKSDPPDLPGPTLVVTPPQMNPIEDDDVFERPTLLDPLEFMAPVPAFATPQGAPKHTAITPTAPRTEPKQPRTRGLSDLPPVLRFGAAAAPTAPQAPASLSTSTFSRGPTAPPPQSITPAATPSIADRPTKSPSDPELDLEASLDRLTGHEPPPMRPPSVANMRAQGLPGGGLPGGGLPGGGLPGGGLPGGGLPGGGLAGGRQPPPVHRGMSGGAFELDLEAPPRRSLEAAERNAREPVRTGLELAQRFSSIPPPSARPARDMLDRYAMGDFSGALSVAEKILESEPHHEEAVRCAQSCRDVLGDMYASRIGDMEQTLMVAMSPDQIRWLSLDHRAGFLLSMIDGISTVDELLDVCGMQRLDALRIICNLLDQRVVSLNH
jgi:hypothetical protein